MGIPNDGKKKQPNMILFLVDDMGWQDTSVPFWKEETEFNKRYHTPGMERLAAEGMLFTQAYATSVCSPTRVSLMSGMNAARHRVTNWTLRRNVSQDASHEILGYPDWNVNGIQPVDSIERSVYATMLPQILKDNGGLSAHHRAGEPHTHNWPLNSGKGSAYEGGIRVPMIVKWPGKVAPATRNNTKVIIEDFFPTILEMAGVKVYKTVQPVDGISFVPLLLNPEKETGARDLFWHFSNNWGPTGPGIGATSTIRSGDWKLIYYYHNQSFELFNIPKDIGEQTNLAERNPEKVKELAGKLGEYLRNVKADRPFYKETGEPVPWPDEVEN